MPRKKTIVEPVEKIWLSTREAASYIGMSTGFIHDLRKGGSLPHCMIGNTAFFLKRDIDALLERNRVF